MSVNCGQGLILPDNALGDFPIDDLLTVASVADRGKELRSNNDLVTELASSVYECFSMTNLEVKGDSLEGGNDFRSLALLRNHINVNNYRLAAYRRMVELYFLWLKDTRMAVPYLLYGLSIAPKDEVLQCYYEKVCRFLKVDKLKIAYFYDNRIGHLCLEYMEYSLTRDSYTSQYTVFIASERPANTLLLDKFKHHIPIVQSSLLYDIHSSCDLVNREFVHKLIGDQAFWHKEWHPKQGNLSDFFRLYDLDKESRPDLLEFSDAEIEYCEETLSQMGLQWSESVKFVCLNVRSNHYLFEHAKDRGGGLTQEVAESLEFRNSTLKNYRKAVQYLIDKGVYVVTVGSHLLGDLELESEFLIDYANNFRNSCRSELMDLYLLSFCQFFLCNSSGITDIAALNKTPLLIVNSAPIQPPFHSRDMYIPKYIVDAKNKTQLPYWLFYRELSIPEVSDSDKNIFCPDGKALSKRGFLYQENSEQDIYDAVVDMYRKIFLKQGFNDDELLLVEKHWEMIPKNHWMSDIKVPIAPSFLKSHHSLFLDKAI